MLSRLHLMGRMVGNLQPKPISSDIFVQNLVSKRWSGHNAMNIEPTNYGWKHFKSMVHFYALVSFVPVVIINTIINIRANPELTEIPEGYEPRHWEYYKHPITRWMAKYMFAPMELEHEMALSFLDSDSQDIIMKKVQKKVEAAMRFYNDHRSNYFRPVYGDYWRISRDMAMYGVLHQATMEGHHYDAAFDPEVNPVPIEGFRPVD